MTYIPITVSSQVPMSPVSGDLYCDTNGGGIYMFSVSTGTWSKVSIGVDTDWEESKRHITKDGFRCMVGPELHCSYGPAEVELDKEDYYIEGTKLDGIQIETFKKILQDISLAPLYVNDPVFKYPAKWMLRNYGKEV